MRDTFLKLLRPGVDYRETFLEYVEKNVFAKRISRFKDDKNYYHKEEDEQRELDEELESLRKEWLSHTSLSKADMAKLLRQMGIALKETEMRSLVDAFDTNGDGVITISEFLDFTGPKRDKRSGNNAVMSQRCCWLTTCRVTGMPGAYSVSAPTKRSLKAEESKSSAEDRYGGPSEEQSAKLNASTLGNVNIVVRKLATGESRMCIELRERRKREDLLRKMGLIDSDGKPAKNSNGASKRTHARNEKNAKRRDAGEDEYEDDFGENDADEEYGDDFDDHDEKHSPQDKNKGKLNASASGSGGAGANSCDFSTWRSEDRKKGLKFMLDLTKDARQEETLKTLLANGVPPAPPKLWVANEHFIETRSLNRSSKASLGRSSRVGGGEGKHGDEDDEDPDHADIGPESTEITLFWGPHKGDLVSFYSIEYGGVVGAQKTSDVKYNEIFRDPEDANPNNEFLFSYTMRNLTPGASYRFRIRAFNGFGAGEYTYKTFTTVTAAPTKPRVIKTCSDSVALKWTFSAGFFRRLEELKKIFLLADSDHSGCVSREELTALLDERASASADLKVFLNKVATSLGLVISQGYDALFDMIEGDDDGGLSWTEFEAFFMAAVSAYPINLFSLISPLAECVSLHILLFLLYIIILNICRVGAMLPLRAVPATTLPGSFSPL